MRTQDGEGDAARAYCLDFVQRRLQRGDDPARILREFNVDADAWPPSADSLEAAALADVILQWVASCKNAEEGSDESSDADSSVAIKQPWKAVALAEITGWDPTSVGVPLTAELGQSNDGVCVLDGLVDDRLRAELMRLLADIDSRAASAPEAPTEQRWERTTCDGAGLPPTWGLQPQLLADLERRPPPCILEVQARLAKLYPEYTLARMRRGVVDAGRGARYWCSSFVANAAVHGDAFQWHVDADPASFPPGAWLAAYGDYANGTAGKPLLVSLLVYLDERWCKEWDAETLFLAEEAGVGLLVQPRPGRAILMHQDVLHRVSAPSLTACAAMAHGHGVYCMRMPHGAWHIAMAQVKDLAARACLATATRACLVLTRDPRPAVDDRATRSYGSSSWSPRQGCHRPGNTSPFAVQSGGHPRGLAAANLFLQ